MATIEEIRQVRLKKLEALQKAGFSAYPVKVKRTRTIAEVLERFPELVKEEKEIVIAGRIRSLREHGGSTFFHIQDGTGSLQIFLKKDRVGEREYKIFVDTFDVGDFIQARGVLFTTKRGEKTLEAADFKVLAKSLLPLPDKWHGLQDVEERYRRRYLDILMDKEVHDRFVIRSKIIKFVREFFDKKNFLEIETPILQSEAGGAMAKTFNTHHNDYDMDMVLRISLELEHKMLMVGGYERVYEIGKNFRNEGSDPTHLQEFTMIEWYAAYQTLETNMTWTEELIKSIATDIMGKTVFKVYDNDGAGVDVDLSLEWPRITFGELLKKDANINIETITLEEARKEALKWGVKEEEVGKLGRGNLLDKIYKKSSRGKIINPTFVTDFPGDLKPLAQQNENGTAKVAQLIIAGAEITNQYAELVNPLIQRDLLVSQAKAKEGGDEEAMSVNEGFLTAMEHGMPPMTGFGMGIDRLVAIFTEQKNLRDVIFFPTMRPRDVN